MCIAKDEEKISGGIHLGRREAFVLLTGGAITLLASTAVANAAGAASGGEARSQTKSPAVAVPAALAVAASVFSIASSLKSLFGGRGSDSGVKQRLDQIIAQNQQILRTLGEIVVVLNNLGVIVRENVRFELIFDKQTALIGQIRQLFEAWSAELVDRRARRQVERRYQVDILPEFRDITRQLMNAGYGFTAADTVGMGMLAEFWLSRRLAERRSIRRETAETYLAFFDRALDATETGTPARQLADAIAQRDRMKVILDAADARIGTTGWTVQTGRGTRSRTNGRRTTYTDYVVLQTATGSQTTQYAYSQHERVVREREEFIDNGGGPSHGGGPHNKLVESGDPRDPGGSTPAARVPYWNAVRTTYLAALDNVDVLTRINETMRFYRTEADSVRIA
jgi:PAS domain-containing protein